LKKGAYAALEDDGEDEGKKFCDEDIDSILNRRTQVVKHTGDQTTLPPEGSLFSKATFSLGDTVALDDPEFWDKWAKKANVDPVIATEETDERFVVKGPRKRRTRTTGGFDEDGDEMDLDDDKDESYATRNRNRFVPNANLWTMVERQRIERGLMQYGFGAWEKKKEAFPKRSINEIKAAETRLLRWCVDTLKKEKHAAEEQVSSTPKNSKQNAAARDEQRLLDDCDAMLGTNTISSA
jgi:hypothetical protein